MTSPVAPVATLFGSAGGVGASGRGAAKTAGEGGAEDKTPTDVMAREIVQAGYEVMDVERSTRQETLASLRALEKDIAADEWMYTRPRHSFR